MSAKRLTTAITLEPAVMHYVRTKSKELGVNGSQFIESCIGLEILNPLNNKTIPKAMKIAGTVELIGLEKAREALAKDSDLTLTVIPKETPVFEPEKTPEPKRITLPETIKELVEKTIKKEIPNSEDIDAASSRGVFSSDASQHKSMESYHDDDIYDDDDEDDEKDDEITGSNSNVVDESKKTKSKVDEVVNSIMDDVNNITIESISNDDTDTDTDDDTDDDIDGSIKYDMVDDKNNDLTEDNLSDTNNTTEALQRKKRIMKMI